MKCRFDKSPLQWTCKFSDTSSESVTVEDKTFGKKTWVRQMIFSISNRWYTCVAHLYFISIDFAYVLSGCLSHTIWYLESAAQFGSVLPTVLQHRNFSLRIGYGYWNSLIWPNCRQNTKKRAWFDFVTSTETGLFAFQILFRWQTKSEYWNFPNLRNSLIPTYVTRWLTNHFFKEFPVIYQLSNNQINV